MCWLGLSCLRTPAMGTMFLLTTDENLSCYALCVCDSVRVLQHQFARLLAICTSCCQVGLDRGCQAHLRGGSQQHDIFISILMAVSFRYQLMVVNPSLASAVRFRNIGGQVQFAPQAAHVEAVCGVP